MISRTPHVVWCTVLRLVAAVVLIFAFSACDPSRVRDGGDGFMASVDSPTGSEAVDLRGWVPLLQGFDLQFIHGDRPLRSIAVGSLRDGTGSFHFELQDGDGGDLMVGSARYFPWHEVDRVRFWPPEDSPYGLQKFIERTGCRSSCDLEIPDYDHDTVLVITGFRFRFPDGENNLRSIGLFFLGLVESPQTLRALYRDDDGAERFDVELSYILFPRSWANIGVIVSNPGSVPGPRNEVPLSLDWRGRIPLLESFILSYAEGDEHVRALGVDGTDTRVVLKLHDDDEVERIIVRARYRGFCGTPSNANVYIQECPEP